jgi:hypothetical protein
MVVYLGVFAVEETTEGRDDTTVDEIGNLILISTNSHITNSPRSLLLSLKFALVRCKIAKY